MSLLMLLSEQPLASRIRRVLFGSGEQGIWLDPSDFSTLYQDAAGTTPVTAVGQTVGLMRDKSGNGKHATQSTAASRPTVEARVNLFTRTEQLDDAAWTKEAASISANAVAAPDGSVTADKIVEDTTTAIHRAYQAPSLLAGVRYVQRWYVKAAGRSWCYIGNTSDSVGAYFNLTSGAVGTVIGAGVAAAITPITNGWYLVELRFTPATSGLKTLFCSPASGDSAVSYLGDGASGIYLWGGDIRQASDAAYPYQRVNTATDYVEVGAPRYLSCDGVDDGMVTPSIDFTATDKMTVWAGIRKLSDAAAGVVAELSATIASNNGAFSILAPASAAANAQYASKGTTQSSATATVTAAPVTLVLTGTSSIGSPTVETRINGVSMASNTFSQGTGTYGNYPLYLFRRGGTTLPFNGRFYGLIVRGAASNAAQIAAVERWMNTKTMAY